MTSNNPLQQQLEAIALVAAQQAAATQEHLTEAGINAVDAVISQTQQAAQQNALNTVAAYAQQRLQGAAQIVSDDASSVPLPAPQGVEVVDISLAPLAALPEPPKSLQQRPQLPNRLSGGMDTKSSSQKRRERRRKAMESSNQNA